MITKAPQSTKLGYLLTFLIFWLLSTVISLVVVFLVTFVDILLRTFARLTHFHIDSGLCIFNRLFGCLAGRFNWRSRIRDGIPNICSSLGVDRNVTILMLIQACAESVPAFLLRLRCFSGVHPLWCIHCDRRANLD